MQVRNSAIQKLLWQEVALKSPPATVAFSAVAILIFCYYFGLEDYKTILRILSVVVIIANVIRLVSARKIIKVPGSDKTELIKMKIGIWLNALAWGMIFSLSAFALDSETTNFAILLAIMTGFLSASVLTLGYDKTIFIPFISLNLVPLILITAYQLLTGIFPHAATMLTIYIILFLYLIKQFKEYHSQLLLRFNYQLDLERAFKEVKKSQETFMQETAKLLHTSKISALSDMAGGLAHEVNNSLQIILGSQQQIQRDLNKNSMNSDYVQEKFQLMDKSIKKISEVIMGLKYFSQEMDKPEKDIVPLKTIIERSLSYTFEMLKAHNVEVDMGDVPPVNVFAHQFQITQIIFNLIKNADDAMSKNETKNLQIKFLIKEGFVFIRFIDNGKGISAENQSRLFQPFFSTKDINLGTGLSLSISKGIALDHGGDLFFDSYEKNTTFVLKLPIHQ